MNDCVPDVWPTGCDGGIHLRYEHKNRLLVKGIVFCRENALTIWDTKASPWSNRAKDESEKNHNGFSQICNFTEERGL